jgi:hypothetical protein
MANAPGATLRRDDGTIVDHPGVDALRATYSDGAPATDSDELAAEHSASCGYSCTSRKLEPCYGGQIYGRVKHTTKGTWLQYWIFYYYRPHGVPGFTSHEGDWRTFQVHLPNGSTNPDRAMYSVEEDGEVCSWTNFTTESDRPVVYVGAGSHAIHRDAGISQADDGSDDEHRGNGRRVDPALVLITDTAPGWTAWPGTWGSTAGIVAGSPPGPAFQEDGDLWDAPDNVSWSTCE